MKNLGRAMIVLMLVGVGAFLVAMMLPVRSWRTGETPVQPLALAPAPPAAAKPVRVWIDADAACGHRRRSDPDDCLALLYLAQSDAVEIVGVSTVFGNAALSVTDPTARALMSRLVASGEASAPVHLGASVSTRKGAGTAPAHEMLRRALQDEPLTIVALGPLTNIATALRDRPDLQARVTRIVAVMGRRKGHLFHPIEGGQARSFLGHGPVFTDLNFAEDNDAVAEVLGMRAPLTLVPYEAAREVMIGGETLDAMAERGGASAWVAERSRSWLAFWREEVGQPGFFPFDLLAAAYVVEPSRLQCADVTVAVGDDTGMFGWFGQRGLFVVTRQEPATRPVATGRAQYCQGVDPGLTARLAARLAGSREHRSRSATPLRDHPQALPLHRRRVRSHVRRDGAPAPRRRRGRWRLGGARWPAILVLIQGDR